MEEIEGGFEKRRLSSFGRRDASSESMETGPGGKNSSERPTRKKSGHLSKRPKNCDKRSHKNCQTGNGLKMVFTIFKREEEEEEVQGSVF